MKSLKPLNEEQATTTLIASSVADELNSKIQTINSDLSSVLRRITSLESEAARSSISKQTVTAQTLSSTNASVSNSLTANEATINTLTAPTITSTNLSAQHVNSDTLRGDVISGERVEANTLSSPSAQINSLSAVTANANSITAQAINSTTVTADSISSPSGTFDSIQVSSINNLSDFSSNNLTATQSISTPLFSSLEANIRNLDSVFARIKKLYTQNQIYTENEEDPGQYVVLTAPSSSSNETDNYSFIELPAVQSGFYRIEVKKENNDLFGVTFINTETAPIVQYSKSIAGDIDKIYYDSLTGKLYVKTYASGRIYFANDDRLGKPNPVVYTELPIDESADTTFIYAAKGKSRVVIMGDNSLDYGVAIQGVLEANLIKESTTYHQLFFYGNSYNALKNFADRFLTYEDLEGNKHYTTSETAGYLYHTDDNYRDVDNTETEALEKISYDGSTITLTVDNKYGQDEITIDDSDGGVITGYAWGQLKAATAGEYYNKVVKSLQEGKKIYYDVDKLDNYITSAEHRGTAYYYYFKDGSYSWFTESVTNISRHYAYQPIYSTEPVYWIESKYLTLNDILPLFEETDETTEDGYPIYRATETIYFKKLSHTFTGYDDYITHEHLDDWNRELVPAYYYVNDGEYLFYNSLEEAKEQNRPLFSESTERLSYLKNIGSIRHYEDTKETPETLPFILSFTTGSYNWDTNMNDEVFNSYASERG